MALPFDFLDSMAWTVAASATLLGVMAFRLPFKASPNSAEEKDGSLRKGLGVAIGGSGLYLFITGLAISFMWPFASTGGAYNILFGGIATLGGLLLLATSLSLLLNAGLSAVSYFAIVVGLYAVVDAFAMINYKLTSNPLLAALGYLSFAATAFFSVPAAHINNKWLRWAFGIFAVLFAVAWLYQAANFTWGHLKPPAP